MSEIQTLTVETPKKQGVPTFLKVLCILSWTWGGLMVLISLLMVVSGSALDEVWAMMIEQTRTEEEELVLLYAKDTIAIQMVASLIGFLVSLVAVTLMYRLKRIGFYLYCFTHVALFVAPFVILPTPSEEIQEAMDAQGGGVTGIVFAVLLLVGFIVLYGVNLKHMKK